MEITKNDVGRFAVTRGGDILKIWQKLDYTYGVATSGGYYTKEGYYFKQYEEYAHDLVQWADEHPIYKTVFTWNKNKQGE